jgi:hypothetical protein
MTWKTTLPNRESQRIQPNEVQIPQLLVGLKNVRGFKRLVRKILKASREFQCHMAGAQAMKMEATRMRRAPRKDAVSEKGPYDWNGARRM